MLRSRKGAAPQHLDAVAPETTMSERFTEAYELALRAVRLQDRFEAELAGLLESKGYSDQIQSILDRLRRQGLLNERRAAAAIISGREGRKAVGTELLRQKLLHRGAPEALVDELLCEDDELEKAYRALEAKFDRDVPMAKAGRFLSSRGFGEEAIESALERFFSS